MVRREEERIKEIGELKKEVRHAKQDMRMWEEQEERKKIIESKMKMDKEQSADQTAET